MARRHSTGEEIAVGDKWIWLAEEYYQVFGDGVHRPLRELASWAVGRGLSDFGRASAGSLEWIRKLRHKINEAGLNTKLIARGTPAFQCLSDGNREHGVSFFTELQSRRSIKDDHYEMLTMTKRHKKKAIRVEASMDKSRVSVEIVSSRQVAVRDIAFVEGVVQLAFAHMMAADPVALPAAQASPPADPHDMDLKDLMTR